jgi:hypothetical protein
MVASGALAEALCAGLGPLDSSRVVANALTSQLEAAATGPVEIDPADGPGSALRQIGLASAALQPNPSARRHPAIHALQASSSPNAWRRQGRLALESVFWDREEHARALASAPRPPHGKDAESLAAPWPTVDLGCETTGFALAKQSPGYASTVSSAESSSLAALAEMIETATLAASEDSELSPAQVPCDGPTPTAPAQALSSDPTPSNAPSPGTVLDSEELIAQFCSSLEQELRDKGLGRSVLRRPAHLWPVTGSVRVDSMRIPVAHSLTKLLWAYQGGLLEPVPAGTDAEAAFGDSAGRW